MVRPRKSKPVIWKFVLCDGSHYGSYLRVQDAPQRFGVIEPFSDDVNSDGPGLGRTTVWPWLTTYRYDRQAPEE